MPKCAVKGCGRDADVEVILYDIYRGDVFFEQDFTCPHLCSRHVEQNESECRGTREPRGGCVYPFSNKNMAQGFTVYVPLD